MRPVDMSTLLDHDFLNDRQKGAKKPPKGSHEKRAIKMGYDSEKMHDLTEIYSNYKPQDPVPH